MTKRRWNRSTLHNDQPAQPSKTVVNVDEDRLYAIAYQVDSIGRQAYFEALLIKRL